MVVALEHNVHIMRKNVVVTGVVSLPFTEKRSVQPRTRNVWDATKAAITKMSNGCKNGCSFRDLLKLRLLDDWIC